MNVLCCNAGRGDAGDSVVVVSEVADDRGECRVSGVGMPEVSEVYVNARACNDAEVRIVSKARREA